MASRFWVGGTGTWDAATTTHWSASSGGAGGASAPTAADDVFINASSGGGTISVSAAVCRSLDCTGAPATILSGASTISVGTSTVIAGNVAVKLVANITTGASTAYVFKSTNATQQTIDFVGKTIAALTFQGAGSSYLLSSGFTSAAFSHTAGTVNFNGQTFTTAAFSSTGAAARTLTHGASTQTCTGAYTLSGSNLTYTCNTQTITMTGSSSNFAGLSQTFGTVQYTGVNVGFVTMTGANTFAAFKLAPSAGSKQDSVNFDSNITVTGTLTITGVSRALPVFLFSSVNATARTVTAATVALTNVDFMDITGAGAATWSGSFLGDAQGNSGITFTAAQAQFWIGGTGNQSDATHYSQTSGGVNNGRVPLPQDNVTVDGSSGAGTMTLDMPRWGKNIDLSASSLSTYTMSVFASLGHSLHGNLALKSGVTYNWNVDSVAMRGRSTQTITSNGASIIFSANALQITCTATGSYSLADAWTSTVAGIAVTNGSTFSFNNQNYTAPNFTLNVAGATVNMGTGVVTLNGTSGTAWANTFGGTVNLAAGSLVKFTGTSGSTAITLGNQGIGDVTFDGVGGTWVHGDGGTMGVVTLVNGTWSINSRGITCTSANVSGAAARTISFTSGVLAFTGSGTVWNATTTTNLTFTKGTGILRGAPGSSSVNQTFIGGGITYNAVAWDQAFMNQVTITGSNGYASLTFTPSTGSNADEILLAAGTTQTVSATMTVTGKTRGFQIFVRSNTDGSTATLNVAINSIGNTDYMDITAAGAASWSFGNTVGDGQGNTGITFVASQNCFWIAGAGGWAGIVGWSLTSGGVANSRVPLIHDDVFIDANSGSGALTAGQARLCRDMTWTGSTITSFTATANVLGASVFGAMTLNSAVTYTFTDHGLRLRTRTSKTITSNGASIDVAGSIGGITMVGGGTYTLADNFTVSGTPSSGTALDLPAANGSRIDTNAFDVHLATFSQEGGSASSSSGGNWFIVGASGTIWSYTGGTVYDGLLNFTDTTSSNKTIAFGGATYTGVGFTGPGGTFTITGSNSFGILYFGTTPGPMTINFTAGTTQTILAGGFFNSLVIAGSAGAVITFRSTIPGTQYTISSGASVTASFVDLQDSVAAGTRIDFHDVSGTDSGNNVHWLFDQSVTFSDLLGLTDKVTATTTATVVDPVGLTDKVTAAPTVTVTDPVGLTDPVTAAPTAIIGDPVGLTDSVVAALVVQPSDPLGLTDTSTATTTATVVDPVGLTDEIHAAPTATVTDPVGLTDPVTAAPVVQPSDLLGLTDKVTATTTATVTDPVGLTDEIHAAPTVKFGDPVGLTDSISAEPGFTVLFSDTLGLTDIMVAAAEATIGDPVGLTDNNLMNLTVVLTDPLGLTDPQSAQVAVSLADLLGLTDSLQAALTVVLDDPEGATDRLFTDQTVTINDLEGLTDPLSVQVAVTLLDHLGATDEIAAQFIVVLNDALGLTDTVITSVAMIESGCAVSSFDAASASVSYDSATATVSFDASSASVTFQECT